MGSELWKCLSTIPSQMNLNTSDIKENNISYANKQEIFLKPQLNLFLNVAAFCCQCCIIWID